MDKLSIVIPIYNEEENILELYRRLKSALVRDFSSMRSEIIFVDDGSSDGTISLVKQLIFEGSIVRLIQLSRNFGHHIAVTAGLDYAGGDFVVTMDGDLQDQPEEIIKLYNKLQEGNDIVYGERRDKKFSWFKRSCSKLFVKLLGLLVDCNMVINSNIFRIMRKQVVDEVRRCREANRYIIGLIGWVGFKHAGVLVEHGKRFKGKTKYTFSKLIRLALDTIFTFSDYPLKLIMQIGFLLVLSSFFFGGWILLKSFFYGSPVKGWSSLIVTVFFMGGVQIFMLGIIGEYLGRTYMETKRRPLYIIKNIFVDKSLKVDSNYEENSFPDRGSGVYR